MTPSVAASRVIRAQHGYCRRCQMTGHTTRGCPERWATILPGPRQAAPDRAHLLALAVELRAGLGALADQQDDWGQRWRLAQAANVVAFAERELRRC